MQEALHNPVRSQGIPNERIVMWANSLWAGAAALLAAQHSGVSLINRSFNRFAPVAGYVASDTAAFF